MVISFRKETAPSAKAGGGVYAVVWHCCELPATLAAMQTEFFRCTYGSLIMRLLKTSSDASRPRTSWQRNGMETGSVGGGVILCVCGGVAEAVCLPCRRTEKKNYGGEGERGAMDCDIDLCVPSNDAWTVALASGVVARYGSRTCDADNVRTSCFAAEKCDRGLSMPDNDVVSLLRNNRCYAAYRPLSAPPGAESRMLGIVAVDLHSSPDEAHVHSLCVDAAARTGGIGSALIRRVIDEHGRDRAITLSVAQPVTGGSSPCPAATAESARRHEKLVRWYGDTFGFTVDARQTVPTYTLMTRRR